jgi:hypothetical protein
MAYVSYGLNRNIDQMNPFTITIGTDDGGNGNNVTLCMDLAVALTTEDVILILNAFIRRLEDGAYGPSDLLNI